MANYIIDAVEKEEGSDAKRECAERCLRNFDSPDRGEIPRGIWDPGHNWPSITEVQTELSNQELFYEKLGEFFGSDQPEVYQRLVVQFQANKEQMLRLARMSEDDRRGLPSHEFGAMFFRFNEEIHRSIGRAYLREVPVESLRFTSELLGSGGFSEVYKADGKDEKRYALKLLRRSDRMAPYLGPERRPFERYIVKNVWDHHEILSSAPFVPPRFIPDEYARLYVLDFFDGKSVDKLITDSGRPNNEIVGRVLLKYAEMLRRIHQNGLIYVDNNLGAVMVGNDTVGIIDYDFISSVEEINNPDHFARKIRSVNPTREQLVTGLEYTVSSDLEGFAQMIYELCTGQKFIAHGWDELMRQEEFANRNKRTFPKSKPISDIPKQLRTIVKPLLRYPRDDSITIDDVICAIKQDFGA